MIKAIIFAALITLPLSAQSIVERQVNQQDRINQGRRSGSLTRPEARRLQTQENALSRQIARDRVDGGGLSRRERSRINHEQNQLNRRIARQKNDRQNRD